MTEEIEKLIEEALVETANLVLKRQVSSRIIMPRYRTDEEQEEPAKIRYSEQELKENFIIKVENESKFYYSVETPSKKVYSITNSEKPESKEQKEKDDHFESARFDLSIYMDSTPESLLTHVEFKHDNKDEKEIEKDFLKLTQELVEGEKNYFVHYLVKGSEKWKSVSFPSIMKKYFEASNNDYIERDTLKDVIVYLMFVNSGDKKSYTILRFNLEEFNNKFMENPSCEVEKKLDWIKLSKQFN